MSPSAYVCWAPLVCGADVGSLGATPSSEPAHGVGVTGTPVFSACSAWGGAHPGSAAWVGKRGETGIF